MSEHRTTATVDVDRSITVGGLPFAAGDAVEVTVSSKRGTPENRYPLRGTAVEYHEPEGPVSVDEWESGS